MARSLKSISRVCLLLSLETNDSLKWDLSSVCTQVGIIWAVITVNFHLKCLMFWSFDRKTYTWSSPKSSHSWNPPDFMKSSRFHHEIWRISVKSMKSGRLSGEIQQISGEIPYPKPSMQNQMFQQKLFWMYSAKTLGWDFIRFGWISPVKSARP